MVSSFKVKLVLYFVLLSFVPIAAAYWGFTTVAGQSETHRVDAELQAGLRGSLAGYQDRLDGAQAAAERLARQRAFQVALQRRERPVLERLLGSTPGLSVTTPGGFQVGAPAGFAANRQVEVVTSSGALGTVTASVPLDAAFLTQLRTRAALASDEVVAALDHGRVVASAPAVQGTLRLPGGRIDTVRVGGVRYRALVSEVLPDVPGARLAVLSPQSRIDAAATATRERLLLGLVACLLLVSVVAYLEGRSIVRTLRGLAQAANGIAHGRLSERVPVRGRDEFAQLGGAFNAMAGQLEARLADLDAERGRLRDAVARFGEALAATHDLAQLLRVIVDGTVEAAGAAGARLTAADGTVVAAGDPDTAGERLRLELSAGADRLAEMELVAAAFDDEQRRIATSLATHAAIALDNERLHRLVEQQALVDGLTGVANRRRCEEGLATEIARADRLGTPLALVLADLDDFKAVNDTHGHAVGDEVLRAFACVLRETVRESDLAGRWGGEEFLLLLPGTGVDGAAQLAERIRLALARMPIAASDGSAFVVTASFGVAPHRRGGDDGTLYAAADEALYRAKAAGKDRVELARAVRLF